jgi:hypothetical protein
MRVKMVTEPQFVEISREEALKLLSAWKSRSALVALAFVAPGAFRGAMDGVVTKTDDDEIVFSSEGAEFQLREGSFHRLVRGQRELSGIEVLEIRFPNGEGCSMVTNSAP